MGAPMLIAGRYEKGKEIGAGGMGSVFLGVDTVTNEQVAIKELKEDIIKQDPDIVERFAREGEALRKLNHPSIVKVLATAEQDDRHYIMMEYVDGGSLRERIQQEKQLSVDEILNIALDVSDALARAHRLKIIHRDIKPANVLIAEDGTPRLTDFGVARIGDTTRLTKTGAIVGTLSYLAPEAINGEKIDARADLWSFGVMLFEMLTGVRPFDSDNTGSMLMNILKDPVPDVLQYRDYDSVGSWGLPGLIYWLLEKEPERRPQSARLVGAVLENLLSGKELPVNWFGDEAEFITGDTPISLPPHVTAQALRDFTTSSLMVDDLIRSGTTPPSGTNLSSAPVIVDLPTPTSSTTAANTMTAPPSTNRYGLMGAGIGILVAIIGLFAVMSGSVELSFLSAEATPIPIVVEPAREGRVLALVAEPERLSGEERDVLRLIIEDLQVSFNDVPFAVVDVQPYPAIIRDEQEAQAIAEQYDAAVIIWGNYDDEVVEMNLQFGDVEAFPNIVVGKELISPVADVRYRMTDPRRQTLAHGIISISNVAFSYSNDVESFSRNVITAELLQNEPAEVLGNTATAHVHRATQLYVTDVEASIAAFSEALNIERGDPMLYLSRALGYSRTGETNKLQDDINSIHQFAPEGWVMADWMSAVDEIFVQGDFEAGIVYIEKIIDVDPNNWFIQGFIGILAYLQGDYETAQHHIDISFANNPQSVYPYPIAAGLALRRGDFARAQAIIEEVLERFPDPHFAERIITAVLSEDAIANSPWVPLQSTFGNFTLGQWNAVLSDSEDAIAAGLGGLSDVYLFRGMAYCNLGQYAEAEAAYTTAIELDPGFIALYMLRADVRTKQNSLFGALQDSQAILASSQAEAFQPLLDAVTSGEMQIGCENFLEADFATLQSDVPAGAMTIPTQAPPEPTPEPTPTPAPVESVADNMYMVLVAQPEHLGGEERDVQRFIVEDLRRQLEENAPFAHIRIRAYPGVIANAEQAHAIAEETAATVIIWGNYDSELVEMNVQAGSLEHFASSVFSQEDVNEIANARYQMSNERRQTLAHGTIATLNMIVLADNGFYEPAENMAVLGFIDTPSADVIGNSIAARYHQNVIFYANEPQKSVAMLDEALSLSANNAILYTGRALAYQRLGDPDRALQDARTAKALGPDNWTAPLQIFINDAVYFRNDYTSAIDLINQIIEITPDDWFPYSYRGTLNYVDGDYEAAATDITRSMELDPQANFPYLGAIGLALRNGEFIESRILMDEVLEKFPNPRYTEQVIVATLNKEVTQSPIVHFASAFGNFLLRQWQETVDDTDEALALGYESGDLYLIRGVAYCGLEEYDAAIEALTRGIEIDPEFTNLRMMRSAIYGMQGNTLKMGQDAAAVLSSPQGEAYAPLLSLTNQLGTGEMNCNTFYDIDIDALLEEAEASGQ